MLKNGVVKRITDGALGLLYPRRCPLCDRVLPYGERVCAPCRKTIVYETEPRCMKCGRSLPEGTDPGRVYCSDCENHPHAFDYGYCLAEYHSVARAIYRMKYANRRENAAWFGEEMAERLGEQILALKPDALVPVPLHRRRMQRRGYNQAADVAFAISRKLGIPVREDLLERTVNTAPMKLSDSEQKRRNNLKNAFQLKGDVVKYDRLVVIDDIYTTGTTIDAVAREFRKAGVSEIYFAAVAGTHR